MRPILHSQAVLSALTEFPPAGLQNTCPSPYIISERHSVVYKGEPDKVANAALDFDAAGAVLSVHYRNLGVYWISCRMNRYCSVLAVFSKRENSEMPMYFTDMLNIYVCYFQG